MSLGQTKSVSGKLWATFDNFGINKSKVSENEKKVISQAVASQVDKQFADWNKISFSKKQFGLGALFAAFETITAAFLWRLEKSPATITNAFTTFSEFAQVLLSNVGDPNDEDWERLREDGVSTAITASGLGGLYKWGKDSIDFLRGEGEVVQELPVWQKTGLSITSLISTLMMIVGFGEKTTFAPLAKEDNGGIRGHEMLLNGNSDQRCSIEWALMTIFPWVKSFRPAKMVIDVLLPVWALREGVGHFIEKIIRKVNPKTRQLLKKLFHINGDVIKSPALFFNKFYLGSKEGGGIRSLLIPLYKFFKCDNPPLCYLNNDGYMSVNLSTTDLSSGDNGSVKISRDAVMSPTTSRKAVADV